MKLPVSVLLATALFSASVWVADSLRADPAVKKDEAGKTANPLEGKAPVEAPETILKIRDNDVIMGDAAAPVTMVEYSSLSCPHCAHFHEEMLPKLKKDFIETGKVRLVIRQFPTNKPALEGAMLVRCLDPQQGLKFEEVLFEMQENWAFTMSSRDALEKIAAVGGVGKEQFDTCLDDKSAEEALLKELMSARDNLGIEGTPTFFINGTLVPASNDYQTYVAAINEALLRAPVPATGEGGQ